MESLKRILNEREMSVKQGRKIVHDGARGEWRAVVNVRVMEEVPTCLV